MCIRDRDLEGWIKKSNTVNSIMSTSDDIVPSLIIEKEKNLQYEQKMGQKTAYKS